MQNLFRRAQELDEAGRLGELENCLKELTTLYPDEPRWWRAIIQVQEQQQRSTEVVQTYRRALAQRLPLADSISLRHQLTDRLIQLGDAAAARKEIARLPSLGGDAKIPTRGTLRSNRQFG